MKKSTLLFFSLLAGLVVAPVWFSGSGRGPSAVESGSSPESPVPDMGNHPATKEQNVRKEVLPQVRCKGPGAPDAIRAEVGIHTIEIEVPGEIAAFREWAEEYSAAAPDRKASLVPRGVALAKARAAVFSTLVRQDPRRAMALALTPAAYAALPEDVRAIVEKPVAAKGTFAPLAVCNHDPSSDHGSGCRIERSAVIAGEEIPAIVYGDGNGRLFEEDASLYGVRIDDAILLHEDRVAVFPEPSGLTAYYMGEEFHFADKKALENWAAGLVAASLEESAPGDAAASGPILDPANPPVGPAPPTEAYNEYTGTFSHQRGPKTMLVVLVRPSDGAAWTNPKSFATLDSELNSTSQFYYNQSFRQTWFGPKYRFPGTASEILIPRLVVTPVLSLPKTSSQYLDSFWTLYQDCLTAIRAQGGNWTNNGVNDPNHYDRIVVMSNSKLINSTGLAYVAGKFAWTGGSVAGNIAMHEIGHNWGVYHANAWNVPAGAPPRSNLGSSEEYKDGFDLMGGGAPGGAIGFNTLFKSELGFLDSTRGDVVNVVSSGIYRIFSHMNPLAGTEVTRVRGLVIPGASFSGYGPVYLGFHHSEGIDGGTTRTDWNRHAVTVHSKLSSGSNNIDTTPDSISGDNSQDQIDSAIKIGRTYSEAANVYDQQAFGGFHITPIARGSTADNGSFHEWIDVAIYYNNDIPSNQPPTVNEVTSTNPTTIFGTNVAVSATPGSPVPLTASAMDPNGDTLAYDWSFGFTGNRSYSINNSPTQSPIYPSPGIFLARVTATDMKGGTATGSTWVSVGNQTVQSATTASILPGLSFRYYEGTFNAMPDFGRMLPKSSGTASAISLAPAQRDNDFAMLFEGFVEAPAAGIYGFLLRADDGARLYINDVLVIDNSSRKGDNNETVDNSVELGGALALAQGLHRLRLEYFHKDGMENLGLKWFRIGQSESAIPTGNLSQNAWTGNSAPSVAITSPAQGAEVLVGSSLAFQSEATDADGITRVQYFYQGTLLGESSSAPYTVVWNNVPVGNQTVVAVAYDTTGRWTTSSPLTFNVTSPPPRNTISVNMRTTQAGATCDLSANEKAGAVYLVPNWNNAVAASSSNATLNVASLRDQTGTPTSASLAIAFNHPNGQIVTTGSTDSPSGRLMRGGFWTRDSGVTARVTGSNIPYPAYDVYVYFDLPASDTMDSSLRSYTLNGITKYGRNSLLSGDAFGDFPNYDTWVGFKEATATSTSASNDQQLGNYLVFRGQNSPSFVLDVQERAAVSGIQIVEADATAPGLHVLATNGSTQVSESGVSDAFSVRLLTAPQSGVTVTLTPDAQLQVSPSSLAFTTENWSTPQVVTVRAVDDALAESSPHAGSVALAVSGSPEYAALTPAPLAVEITDNDSQTVSIFSSGAASETGASTGRFEIVRTGGNISAPLTIALTLNGSATTPGDYSFSGASHSFNGTTGSVTIPANTARVVLTVAAVNDTAAEGAEAIGLALASGAGYAVSGTNASASLAIVDNDATDYLAEKFLVSGSPFDLNGTSVTFTPSGNSYTWTREQITAFPGGTSGFSTFNESAMSGGTADDGYWSYSLPAACSLFGVPYASGATVYVGTNGYITLGQFTTDTGKNLGDLFFEGRPRLSPIGADLDPGAGGSVQYRRTTTGGARTIFFWNAARIFGQTNTVNAQLEIFDDGRVRMSWLNCTNTSDVLVGLGSGVTAAMPSAPYTTSASPRPFYPTNFLLGAPETVPGLRAPEFATAPTVVAPVGQVWTYQVGCFDADGDTLQITAPSRPAWMTLGSTVNGAALLSGTPPAPGSYAVALEVSDGTRTARQEFSLLAGSSAGNSAPLFQPVGPQSASVGIPFSTTISATDPDSQPVSFAIVSGPSWLALTDAGNGTATLGGTPPEGALSALVTVSAGDGFLASTASFSISVNAPPVAEILSPAAAAIAVPGTGSRIELSGSAADDGNPQGSSLTYSWSLVSGPGNATFSTPAKAQTTFSADATGLYLIRLTVSDGTASGFDEVLVSMGGSPLAALTQNIEGYWKFDEGTGTTAADSSGNNRNAAFASALAWSTNAISGNSVSGVGGSNDYTTVATFSEPAQITAAAWARIGIAPANGDRYVFRFRAGSNDRFRVYIPSGSRRLRVAADRNPTDGVWECPVDLPGNEWLHIAVTQNNSSASNPPQIFINGIQAAVNQITAPSGSVQLGTSLQIPGSWHGNVDEARVYSRILPATEIALLGAAGASGSLNTAPAVDAGPDTTGLAGQPFALAGSATDDSLPASPGAVTTLWEQISGPQPAFIADPANVASEVTFPVAGTYVLRLTADDGDAVSLDDVVIEIAALPAAPSAFTATASGNASITLAWTDNSADELGFTLQRSTTQLTGFTTIATLDPGATSHEDTGLATATTYYYRLSSFNGVGASAVVSANATTAAATGGFSSWASHPAQGLPADKQGPLDDPDGDGLPNLLEYAFGRHPMSSNNGSPASPSVDTQGRAAITFRQIRGGSGTPGIDYSADGLRYAVEVSSDLTTWRSGPDWVEPAGTPVDNGDGTETVTVRAKIPAQNGRQFLRVFVETP